MREVRRGEGVCRKEWVLVCGNLVGAPGVANASMSATLVRLYDIEEQSVRERFELCVEKDQKNR